MSTTIETSIQKINLEGLRKSDINLVIFGHGLVGQALIEQILAKQQSLLARRDLNVKIIAVANSTKALFNVKGIDENWEIQKNIKGESYRIEDIFKFVKKHKLENCIAIDNTADEVFVEQYEQLVENGFHLISSNKKGNTKSLDFYTSLRTKLQQYNKNYLYETNVGAGLPLIDTIALLHASGENITKIRGVFSGSLSYIFNTYSNGNLPFSEVLSRAIRKGYTEPDPREDLNGNDVARKLLILARELDLHNELEDVKIENLVPKDLRGGSKEDFLKGLHYLDVPYKIKKSNCREGKVLRYVAELAGDLTKSNGAKLAVRLVEVDKDSVIGQLKGSDTIFEIYTENYGKNPIVIQGAGAGAEVTARGVFGDILRLSEKIK